MSDELLIQHAQRYAAPRNLQLAERLGFGIHGIVYVTEIKTKPGKRAIKALREQEFFERELEAYQLLHDAGVSKLLGFHVPQLIDFDEALMVIEMTVVTRPFVLDFAGAYVGGLPEFSEEIWDEWERHKKEQFGSRWPTVENVLAELRKFNIYMVDVSPSNIAFL
jgi:hypothetical protein